MADENWLANSFQGEMKHCLELGLRESSGQSQDCFGPCLAQKKRKLRTALKRLNSVIYRR